MPTVAYRATRSRRRFANARKVKQELGETLDRKSKPDLIREHEKRVANWETAIGFAGRKRIRVDEISVQIYPTGPNKAIWFYVDRGTSPHVITARNAPYLVFVWGGPGSYSPKTNPPDKYGGPGVVVGGSIRKTKSVNHPGNEAREHTAGIKKKYKRTFSRDMNNAFRRGIRSIT